MKTCCSRTVAANLFTAFWMTVMALWTLFLHFYLRLHPVSYRCVEEFTRVLAFPFTLSALLCVAGYHKSEIFRDRTSTSLGSWAVAGLLFWTLFPPIWFFVEYHGVASGALILPVEPGQTAPAAKEALKSEVKDYAEAASKIWAAFLVLYGFIVSQRAKEQEEKAKKNLGAKIYPDSSELE